MNIVTSDPGQDAMQKLQNQWYNTIVVALKLDPNSFQLIQAQSPLSNTSKGLWQYFDSVPPKSLTQVFSQSAINSFFDDYLTVIITIIPQASDKFRVIMGDNLDAWEVYKKTLKPGDVAKDGIFSAFQAWADINLDPDIATNAITAYQQLQNGVVSLAVNAVLNQANLSSDGRPTFSKTMQELRDAITHGATKTFSFDSTTAIDDVSQTWAKGEVNGTYDFFSGSAGSEYTQLSQKATSSRVTVQGSFQKVISFAAGPGKWFNSSALALAYGTTDNTVWPAGQKPDWETTFGEQGNLQRLLTELIVVDGIEISVTSHVSYDATEQQTIKAEASTSFWPFFSANASGGHSTDITFNASGEMTVTTTVPLGNPAIFGVNVLPISKVLGHNLGLASPLLTVDELQAVPNACTYNGKSYPSGAQVCMENKMKQCQKDGSWHWTRRYC